MEPWATALAEAASTVLLVVVLAAAQRLDRPRITPSLLGGLTLALVVAGALTRRCIPSPCPR